MSDCVASNGNYYPDRVSCVFKWGNRILAIKSKLT